MASKLHLRANPTLADLQAYAQQMVEERGFNQDISQTFMLLIEEVGEFAKASRKQAGVGLATDAAKQDVAGEAADILVVLLCICNRFNIDLEQAFRTKEDYNKQRRWTS